MDIRILRYFLTVVREGSITRAAEVLHITQPTLSRQLAQLEEDLSIKLFDRGARRITLTNEGMLLRRRAQEIMELVDKTEQELSMQEELVEGCISIGSGELAAVRQLAKLISSFCQKYPLVTYDLFTANADQVKEKMESGLIDIGLLLEPVDIEKYDYIRLNIGEQWAVLMRPDDTLTAKEFVTAKDLSGLPIIMTKRSNVENELRNWFGDYFASLNILFHSNLPANGAIMVQEGLGYSLVIEGVTSALWDKKKICSRPLYPELATTSVLAWKRHQPCSNAVQRFIEHIKYFSDKKLLED